MAAHPTEEGARTLSCHPERAKRVEGSLKKKPSLSSRASVEGSCLERLFVPNTAKELVTGALTRKISPLALLGRNDRRGRAQETYSTARLKNQGSRKSQRSEIFGKRSGRRSGQGGKRSAPSAMAPCQRRAQGDKEVEQSARHIPFCHPEEQRDEGSMKEMVNSECRM